MEEFPASAPTTCNLNSGERGSFQQTYVIQPFSRGGVRGGGRLDKKLSVANGQDLPFYWGGGGKGSDK